MGDVSFIVAFSAGLLSFLSPCVLPLVPAYLSYITGSSLEEIKNEKRAAFVLYKSVGFVLGFSLIFIVMGAAATSIGKVFIKNQYVFKKAAGILIFIFGLHMTGIIKIKFFYYEKRLVNFKIRKGLLGSVIMGIAFAAGWTPCVGPILSSILVYAGSLRTVQKGIILLTIYSLGLAVPFILMAFLIGQYSIKLGKVSKYFRWVSVISGILMIVFGVLIFTNKIWILSKYLNFINF